MKGSNRTKLNLRRIAAPVLVIFDDPEFFSIHNRAGNQPWGFRK